VRPYLKKNPSQKKRAGGVAQGVGPEFKPSTAKKKKQKANKIAWIDGVAQVVERLLSKPEALSNATKKTKPKHTTTKEQ
jgi:hypothetical protein